MVEFMRRAASFLALATYLWYMHGRIASLFPCPCSLGLACVQVIELDIDSYIPVVYAWAHSQPFPMSM